MIERHCDAVRSKDQSAELLLSRLFLWWPALIRFLEPIGSPRNERQRILRARLDAALAICEVSSESSDVFHLANGSGTVVIMRLIGQLAIDILTLPIRLFVTKIGMSDGR